MRSPRTTTKSSPRSPQLEKARVQQQRPNAAKKKERKEGRQAGRKEGRKKERKVLTIKEKIDKSNNIKIRSLWASKGIINGIIRQVKVEDVICNTYNQLETQSKIYKGSLQISKKKTIHGKMGKHLRKKSIKMANKPYY